MSLYFRFFANRRHWFWCFLYHQIQMVRFYLGLRSRPWKSWPLARNGYRLFKAFQRMEKRIDV